jgi:RNA-directed DNA polymerase
MTVEDLGAYLRAHGPTIRAALLKGTDAPQPVRRTAIPKPGGGTRNLGIPTVRDRVVRAACKLVVEAVVEASFRDRS